jgi:hypothetical protein
VTDGEQQVNTHVIFGTMHVHASERPSFRPLMWDTAKSECCLRFFIAAGHLNNSSFFVSAPVPTAIVDTDPVQHAEVDCQKSTFCLMTRLSTALHLIKRQLTLCHQNLLQKKHPRVDHLDLSSWWPLASNQ